MSWCDKVLGYCDASGSAVEPGPAYDDVVARIGTLPVTDWVRAWREVCRTRFSDQTPGVYAFKSHFDSLSHNDPERGVAFIEAALQHETDDEVLLLLARSKVLGQLMVFRAETATPLLQELALRQPRLRILLGLEAPSIEGGMVADAGLKRRLLAICDEPAGRAGPLRLPPLRGRRPGLARTVRRLRPFPPNLPADTQNLPAPHTIFRSCPARWEPAGEFAE